MPLKKFSSEASLVAGTRGPYGQRRLVPASTLPGTASSACGPGMAPSAPSPSLATPTHPRLTAHSQPPAIPNPVTIPIWLRQRRSKTRLDICLDLKICKAYVCLLVPTPPLPVAGPGCARLTALGRGWKWARGRPVGAAAGRPRAAHSGQVRLAGAVTPRPGGAGGFLIMRL
jgi:hypothetical protein